MFEVVAVQQVPAGVVGEPHGHLDGFAWRDIDGVLPPAVVWAWALAAPRYTAAEAGRGGRTVGLRNSWSWTGLPRAALAPAIDARAKAGYLSRSDTTIATKIRMTASLTNHECSLAQSRIFGSAATAR
jgi:hypothetical protein